MRHVVVGFQRQNLVVIAPLVNGYAYGAVGVGSGGAESGLKAVRVPDISQGCAGKIIAHALEAKFVAVRVEPPVLIIARTVAVSEFHDRSRAAAKSCIQIAAVVDYKRPVRRSSGKPHIAALVDHEKYGIILVFVKPE